MKKNVALLMSAALSVVVLIAAGMLPAVFAKPVSAGLPPAGEAGAEAIVTPGLEEIDTDDRFGLWSLWWTSSDSAGHTAYSYVPEAAYDSVVACSAKLEQLKGAFVLDSAESFDFKSGGDEYLRIRDGSGRGMDVWHTFLEWSGDWKNWVDAYFDAKTGELLYFYLSTGCIANEEKYMPNRSVAVRSEAAAEMIAKALDLRIISIESGGAVAEPAFVEFFGASGAFKAAVTCNDYTGDLKDPGNFFDLVFVVTG